MAWAASCSPRAQSHREGRRQRHGRLWWQPLARHPEDHRERHHQRRISRASGGPRASRQPRSPCVSTRAHWTSCQRPPQMSATSLAVAGSNPVSPIRRKSCKRAFLTQEGPGKTLASGHCHAHRLAATRTAADDPSPAGPSPRAWRCCAPASFLPRGVGFVRQNPSPVAGRIAGCLRAQR